MGFADPQMKINVITRCFKSCSFSWDAASEQQGTLQLLFEHMDYGGEVPGEEPIHLEIPPVGG